MILSIIALVMCLISMLVDIINEEYGSASLFLLLALFNALCVYGHTQKKTHSNEVKTEIITDVKGYQIDSTITITGQDTTKTYVLTYWK